MREHKQHGQRDVLLQALTAKTTVTILRRLIKRCIYFHNGEFELSSVSSLTSLSELCMKSFGLTVALASREQARLLCHTMLNEISCTGKQRLRPLL